MNRAAFLLEAVVLLLLAVCAVHGQPRPLILIYVPGSPNYAEELQRIIEEDGRLDAEIKLVESLDNFRIMLYLPYVKIAIISLSVERDQNLESALEWFFSEGGGLVALGLTASKASIGAASETVFPIFATTYRTGTYDGSAGRFTMTHIKEDEDEISRGLSDFTISDHKMLLSFNTSTQAYLPRSPEAGDYKVLFREKGMGAPSVVKYQNQGVSVTFACFGGDDYDWAFNYYGQFAGRNEFRTLFANAVYWVWSNERRYDKHMAQAGVFAEDAKQDALKVKEEAEELKARARNARTITMALIAAAVAIACIAVYWVTFVRVPKSRQEDNGN